MAPDQLDLLRTYSDGRPVIWDATALLPAVHALADQGLIERWEDPDPDPALPGWRGTYALTAKGRQVLDAQEAS